MSVEPLIPRASESGHWYYRDGTPCYEILSADKKKMVTPDVRHARKLGLVPGVTGIIGCADKPGLTIWKCEQAILSSLTLTRRPHEPDREFLKRVFDDSQEQAKRAAEMGTAIHAAIEGYFTRGSILGDDPYYRHVVGADDAINAKFGTRKWKTEHAFASPMGYGSKIDLCTLEAPVIIIDSKGKEFDEKPTATNGIKLWWDEHAMQLAAYRQHLHQRHGWPLTSFVCANLFFSRNVPGLSYIHVWENDELDRGWSMFKALHAYWCAARRYDPSWEEVKEAA